MEGWACTSCSGDNPFGMPYCGHCGVRDETDRALATGLWGCRSCGTVSPEVMRFCGRCGLGRMQARSEDLRLVTSLFADISGFTTLADTLDVEDLHAVINPLIGDLAGIAERFGGFVAKYAGDALLCLFGAPDMHEDDPQRALLAALEMQARLPSLLAPLGPAAAHLTIHVGVNSGRVIAGAVGSDVQSDYSVLGDAVILAQRLESVCPPGQTYVGESTRDLCADDFDFEDLGELTLKGKLKTVRGFRLVGRRRSGTAVTRPLVGRDAELAALLGGLESRGAVVVTGEPGIGKSRLLAEARVRATSDGVRWMPMRCLSYGALLPFWPFADLLRQSVELRADDTPERVRERLAETLPAHVVPGACRLLGVPVDRLEPEAARRQVLDALAGMLATLSGGRPVTLAVEDLHWSDEATLEALGELVRTSGDVPLSLVLTSRPEGVQAALDLAAQADPCVHVEVGPLSDDAVPQVAAAVLDRPVLPSVTELLLARTRGNPLFVEQLARALQDDDAFVATSTGADLRPGYDVRQVPDTVERVLAARVDALPLEAASVLAVAAVVGRVSRSGLLQRVADSQGVDLARLDDLVAAGLLDRVVEFDEPAWAFHHALLHDVVYGRLLRKQRRVLHRAVADAGRALYGEGDDTVELLARHLYLADAGEDAVPHLLRAGERAGRLFAHDSAAQHLSRAVEVLEALPGDDARLPEARLSLAQVQELRGVLDAALPLFEQVRAETGDPRAWRGCMSVRRLQGDYDGVVALFSEAMSALDRTAATTVPLWLETAGTLALQGRHSDAVSMLRTILRQPTLSGQVHLRAEALYRMAWAESQLGRDQDSTHHVEEALTLLAEAPPGAASARLRVSALRAAGGVHIDAGDLDRAAEVLQQGFAIAEEQGLVVEAAGCLVNLGYLELERDPARSVQHLRIALDRFRRLGNAGGQAVAMANLADALLRAGEVEEAVDVGTATAGLAERIGHLPALADVRMTLGRAELERGLAASAETHAVKAETLFSELGVESERDAARELAERARAALRV